jgi:hypothetical protein
MTYDGLAPRQVPDTIRRAPPVHGQPHPHLSQMFGFHPQLSSAALSHLLSGLPNANAAPASASGSSTPGVGHGAAADGLPAGSFAAHARSLSLAALNAKAGGVHHSHSHPPQHPHPHRGLSGSRSDSDPPQGTGTAPSSGRAPSHRSRNGCYTCRRRKVKCDERTPVCIKCEYSDRKVSTTTK